MTVPFDWARPGADAQGLQVVTVGVLPTNALAAIEAAVGRVAAAIGWDALDKMAPIAGLILAGVSSDIGHGALERLSDVIVDRGGAALVAVEADALDIVWSVLGEGGAELLCDADAGDWAAALVLASHRGNAPPAVVREGADADAQLRRLHAEVARIAASLANLANETRPDGAVDERRRGFRAEPPAAIAIDAGEVRQVIRARRMRAQFFDARLLEDPGWDMLLDLFAAELEGMRVSVSSLCIAAAVAPTTALRWISRMADAGLMVRVADPGDRRRAFIALSVDAAAAMRAFAGAAKRAGLPLV